METALNVLIGVGLAATCGFRVFVPFLVLGVAGLAGYVDLGSGFQWIATYPAVIIFGVATVVEILAYFFPYVDNLLAAVSTPVSVVAGIMVTAAVMTDISPILQWSLAIIAGGGAATAASAASNGLHHSSTIASAGATNPLVSAVESAAAVIASVLAVAVPILAAILITVIIFLIYKIFIKVKRRLTSR